jgi:Ca2+-binding EF-hand superfamily protein
MEDELLGFTREVYMVPKNLTLGVVFLASVHTLGAQQSAYIHSDDTNRDGSISQAEWRGRMSEFRDLDQNRDGILSGNEVPGSRRSGSQNREDRTAYGGERQRSVDGSSAATRLDKDQSGVVEGYEWPYNAEVFHQLDTDRDSVLSADELRNITSVNVRALDKNGNGRLDSNEWPGGYADFERLDENRDGRVNANEYSRRGGDWQKRQRFDQWDSDRNGLIDSQEWRSAPRLLKRLDSNGDSRVSWEEFRADTERYNPPYNWR